MPHPVLVTKMRGWNRVPTSNVGTGVWGTQAYIQSERSALGPSARGRHIVGVTYSLGRWVTDSKMLTEGVSLELILKEE